MYNIEFIGRRIGALGISYHVSIKLEAKDEAQAIEKLYDRYENISILKIWRY